MNCKTYLSRILAILLFSSSCVQEVDIDSSREETIVLNALLSADQTEQTLTLTINNRLGAFMFDEIQTPVITLYCDDVPIGNYTRTAYSKWKINHKPSAGGNYKITVSAKGFPEITAETTMPEKPKIQTPTFSPQEPVIPKAYHQQIPFAFSGSSNAIWSFSLNYLFTDGESFNPTIPYEAGYTGPLPKNISIANLGTDYTEAEVFLNKYIRIAPTSLLDKECFNLKSDYFEQSIIFFRNASNEYDEYMRSSLKKALLFNEEYDISRWFDESSIYTNVKNGLGIFASYNDYIFVTHLPDEISP